MLRLIDALYEAISLGDLERVRDMLQMPARTLTFDGTRALRMAIQQHDPSWSQHGDLVRLLLPFALPSDHESQVLIDAARQGQTEAVRALLEDPRPIRALPNDNQSMALRQAAREGRREIVRLLLEDPRPERAVPNHADSEALWLAAQFGHEAVVQLLLADERADDRVRADAEDDRALHGAVEAGHVSVVRVLLDDRRPHHVRLEGPLEELMWTLSDSSDEMVELVLSDERLLARTDLPSVAEAMGRRLPVLQRLLEPLTPYPEALRKAARIGNVDGVRRLRWSSEPRLVSDTALRVHHSKALRLAVARGHLEVVRALLNDSQIGRAEADDQHSEVLWLAVRYDRIEVLRLLLQDNRPHRARTEDRPLLLSYAIHKGRWTILRLLLWATRLSSREERSKALVDVIERPDRGVEGVRLLLQDRRETRRAEPCARHSFLLRRSAWLGRPRVVQLLLRDPHPSHALPSDVYWRGLVDEVRPRSEDVLSILLDDPSCWTEPRSPSVADWLQPLIEQVPLTHWPTIGSVVRRLLVDRDRPVSSLWCIVQAHVRRWWWWWSMGHDEPTRNTLDEILADGVGRLRTTQLDRWHRMATAWLPAAHPEEEGAT